VTLLVDTSVWSLALRRDAPDDKPEVQALVNALSGSELVVSTGLILQELLQGFTGPKASAAIIERFNALALVQPERDDFIAAAEVRNKCRRKGVQMGTVAALIAQLCIRHDLTLLTTDLDFRHAAKHCALKVWSPLSSKKRNP
jgi:predicted nucleic acid-binding protein